MVKFHLPPTYFRTNHRGKKNDATKTTKINPKMEKTEHKFKICKLLIYSKLTNQI